MEQVWQELGEYKDDSESTQVGPDYDSKVRLIETVGRELCTQWSCAPVDLLRVLDECPDEFRESTQASIIRNPQLVVVEMDGRGGTIPQPPHILLQYATSRAWLVRFAMPELFE